MKTPVVVLILIVLIAGLAGLSYLTSEHEKQSRVRPVEIEKPPALQEHPKATMKPGSVVELHTSKGEIDFVLFEKDCPKTTSRIVDLVNKKAYDGVAFPRVENWVIQTGDATKAVQPMGVEIADGLVNAKGSVGMAHVGRNYNSNTSVFYILLEPAQHLNNEFTVFGRVIRGMDVAMKIKLGDTIKQAVVRPLTEEDRKAFMKMLQIESERKTE